MLQTMRENERQSRLFAKTLRRNLTDAETVLWSKLQEGRPHGYRFRRQHPIGPFIVDFASVRARLVIEVDGATHGTDDEQEYDRRRESWLLRRGWRVLRFTNSDVYESLDSVVEAIHAAIPAPARSVRTTQGEP
jgi:very-short-patch-repair endonuclease